MKRWKKVLALSAMGLILTSEKIKVKQNKKCGT